MAKQKRRERGSRQGSEIIRFVRFGAIPLIVLLLIVIIMIADRWGREKDVDVSFAPGLSFDEDQPHPGNTDQIIVPSAEEDYGEEQPKEEGIPGDDSSQEQAGDGEAEGFQESLDPSDYPLLQDTMLELTGLVQSYCQAKKECDPDLLAQVFGINDWTEEEKNEERARMELVKASIKSYENISCYFVQGQEANSYVIFPYYEIQYRAAETLMPAISWSYVRKNENGQYYMVQETDETVNEYIRKVGEKPEVKAVMAQVQARQQEAVASDEALQKIYGSDGGSEVIIGGNAG